MPDMLDVLVKWWRKIAIVTLLITTVVLIITLLLPDEYLSVATALPANSALADKARIFNTNIEALYPDIGTSDELDKIVGTAVLDTIYIATSKKLNLAEYYKIPSPNEGVYQAALRLKKHTKISKSAYGELKVQVWDEDKNQAAVLANNLLQELQMIHQSLQNQSNTLLLKKLKDDYVQQQQLYQQTADSLTKTSGALQEIMAAQKATQLQQLLQYDKLIADYQLALNANPQVLLLVEAARPALKPDQPKRLPTIILTIFASVGLLFLIAVFIESQKRNAGSLNP